MAEPDESRLWKYLELPQVFQQKATEIDILCKQHLRICERLAGHLVKQKPRGGKEFEQNEYMKNFVTKSADLNEQTIDLLGYIKRVVQEVCDDYKALREGAKLNRIIRDQGEKIMKLIEERDEFMHKYYGLKKSERS